MILRVALGLLLALVLGTGAALAQDPAILLYRELKCPICDTSLEASETQISQQMKAVIREKLAAGESPEQIKAFFVERYGEGILMAPPKEGGGLAAWIMPAVGIIIGVGIVAVALNKFRRGAETPPPEPVAVPPDEQGALAARFDAELRQSRVDD